MTMPRVTVVMPTYERTIYLQRALSSVLDQTFTDIAVKVNDNSETDAVRRFLDQYPDPRITYEHRRANLGGGLNWILSMQEPETEYVASMNDDDAWDLKFLEQMVGALDAHPSAAMAFCEYRMCDEHGEVRGYLDAGNREASHWDELPPGLYRAGDDDLLRAIVVWFAVRPAWAGLARSAAVRNVYFPGDVAYVGDLWLPYKLYHDGCDFVFVNEVLSEYRFHGANVSVSGKAVDDYVFRHVLDHLRPDQEHLRTEVLEAWCMMRFSRLITASRAGNPSRAQRRELAELARHLHGRQRVAAQLAALPVAGRPVRRALDARGARLARRGDARAHAEQVSS
jgi:glycosyltransferase involved in cell wall biosynthesis